MEAFALDPVDEMCARVRARWAAADRRRANEAWWCADMANVPRTPPHVLMNALVGEFDAYAEHRRSTEAAVVAPAVCEDTPPVCPRSGITPPTKCLPSTSSMHKRRVWVAVAISAAAIALLIALVALALAPVVRARVDDQTGRDDDVGDFAGTTL